MADKFEIYKYPVQYRTIANVAPILLIGASILISFIAWRDTRAAGWINQAGDTINPIMFTLLIVGSVILSAFFGLCIHLTYPTINKSKEGFQIETRVYKSKWFSWDDIKRVGLPPSKLVTQIYTIGVPGLHPVYWIIGLSRGVLAPGFLIHPRMIHGDKLLRAMIKQRPELFEE
ncbi:MAG: hypothetical protein AAGD96_10335 [Chloroflexota bacterium]